MEKHNIKARIEMRGAEKALTVVLEVPKDVMNRLLLEKGYQPQSLFKVVVREVA